LHTFFIPSTSGNSTFRKKARCAHDALLPRAAFSVARFVLLVFSSSMTFSGDRTLTWRDRESHGAARELRRVEVGELETDRSVSVADARLRREQTETSAHLE
jgi:hypothetical protein